MTQIYLFEVFMDQLIFMKDQENPEVVANVTAGNILDFYILLSKNRVIPDENDRTQSTLAQQFYKGGKSVFFSCTPEKIIESLETDLKVIICDLENKDEFGSAMLQWKENFKEEVLGLTENIKNIRHIAQFDIMVEEEKIAVLDLNMLLLCYGETIEMAIVTSTNSTITIPILIPKYGNSKVSSQKPKSLVAEPWKPLFNSPYKEKNSIIDVDLVLYAQMAGIVTDETMENKRLTVDYINKHLCGNKCCPGAIKFRDWGIGPLASPGSGLGVIGQLTDAKPCGLYGMSQAYGTMEPYGAFGLFVDKNKETKATCGSPTCPFTKPEEPEEKMIGSSLDERLEEICCIQNKNKTVKCTCKCCGKKYVKRFPSTCEDPLCPSVPKKRIYKCKGPICPHTVPESPSKIDCGGEECPVYLENDPTCQGRICPYSVPNINKCCVTESCPKETAKRLRGGADDLNDIMCYRTCRCCNKLIKKKKTKLTNIDKQRKVGGADNCDPNCINMDGSYVFEYGAASTRNWRSQSNLPNSCTDPNCSYKHLHESFDGECPAMNAVNEMDDCTITDSSWGKPKAANRTCPASGNVPDTCIIKKCPEMDDEEDDDGTVVQRHEYEITKVSGTDAKIERMTRLVNEAGHNMLVSGGNKKNLNTETIRKSLLNTKHLLSDIMSFEEDDDEMIFLIARLLGQREFSHSMNNFYMDEYFSESRLKERNDQAVKQLVNTNDENFQPQTGPRKPKEKMRGPCQKDTCGYMKYKTCSECGGISKSGATCDNSDVSFSYISYSDAIEGSTEENVVERREKRPTNTPNENRSNNKHHSSTDAGKNAEKKHVDIRPKRKRKTRFIYNCGENYPGIRLGHKYCRTNNRDKNNVPFDMGWLWSVKPDGIKRRRKNWKPGMINTIINDRIIAYRKKRGIPDPPELKMIVPTRKKNKNSQDNQEESSDDEVEPKPTLIIQKKEGSYLITMNPLKDPKTLADHENPYMTCKPMQFVITRPKPLPKKAGHGNCGGEGDDSVYDNMYDDDECFCNGDPNANKCPSSSSSDSELNIEFTTPAGLIYPEEMKRPPNVVHTETQFKEADFNCQDCPIILPKKFNKKGKSSKKKK